VSAQEPLLPAVRSGLQGLRKTHDLRAGRSQREEIATLPVLQRDGCPELFQARQLVSEVRPSLHQVRIDPARWCLVPPLREKVKLVPDPFQALLFFVQYLLRHLPQGGSLARLRHQDGSVRTSREVALPEVR
jgi:hypothetical protein